MRSTIYSGNPVPVVLKAGEVVTIVTASGTSGAASVPGEGVADSLFASSTKTYGAYASDREVIIKLSAGSASIQVGKEGGVGFVDGTGSPVSGAAVSARAAGTTVAPVSTFNGASSSGALGLPNRIRIPGGTIIAGASRASIKVQLRKTGADTGFFQLHFGPLDSSADPNLLTGASPQFTSLNPSEWLLTFEITFTAGRAHVTWQRNSLNVGIGAGFPTEQTGLDYNVDNYINFVISGAAAGSTYGLLGYEVQVFR